MDQSLDLIDKAIAHTPTVIELYTHKAKIFQVAGNRERALELTEQARNLDLADRYLNAYSAKFMFKNNEVKKAHETMGLFSKEMENGKLNVHEMQTMWFEVHCGLSHYRLQQYREALKQFNYIEQHLETMLDDCYDFHHYAFRRVTINNYLQMLELNDKTYQGKYPIKGCVNFLRTLAKIQKVYNGNSEPAKKEYEEYKATEEYKKWLEYYEKREDEDPIRYDPDPEGYELLIKAIEKPIDMAVSIASKTAPANPTSGLT